MLRKLNIGRKLAIVTSLPIVVISFLVVFSLVKFSNLNESIEHIYDDNVLPLVYLKNVNDAFSQITSAVNKADNGIILPVEAFLQIKKNQKAIDANWQLFNESSFDDKEKKLVDDATELFSQANIGIIEVSQVLEQMGSELTWDEDGDTLLVDYNGDLYDLVDPISDLVTKLTLMQIDYAKHERVNADVIYKNSKFSYMFIVIISVSMLVLISLKVSRSISAPLNILRKTIEKIEINKDFTIAVENNQTDEIGRLASSFKNMMNVVVDVLANIQTTFTSLEKSVNTLSSNSEKVQLNLSQQMLETETVSNGATLMSHVVIDVSRVAQEAANVTDDAKASAEIGMDILNQTTLSINALATRVTHVGENIQRVENNSEEIGCIIDVIGTIAEQTNLLALNAAIEAARAGEQGRGFAVVAEEVRSLATRTQEATLQIKQMIEKLQVSSKEAVEAVEISQVDMKKTLSDTEKVTQSFNKIVHAVSQINELSHQIATSTEEQETTGNDMIKNLDNISLLCKQSTSSTNDVDKVSTELNNVAKELRSMLAGFNI